MSGAWCACSRPRSAAPLGAALALLGAEGCDAVCVQLRDVRAARSAEAEATAAAGPLARQLSASAAAREPLLITRVVVAAVAHSVSASTCVPRPCVARAPPHHDTPPKTSTRQSPPPTFLSPVTPRSRRLRGTGAGQLGGRLHRRQRLLGRDGVRKEVGGGGRDGSSPLVRALMPSKYVLTLGYAAWSMPTYGAHDSTTYVYRSATVSWARRNGGGARSCEILPFPSPNPRRAGGEGRALLPTRNLGLPFSTVSFR